MGAFVTIFIFLPLLLSLAAVVGLAIMRIKGSTWTDLAASWETLRLRLEGKYKPMDESHAPEVADRV